MVDVHVLIGIGTMLVRARKKNGGRVLEKRDRDGTIWVYRWEDTVEAEMLETVKDLLIPIVAAQGAQQAGGVLNQDDSKATPADAREVEHWLLYRARVWQHGQTIRRRRKSNAGESL